MTENSGGVEAFLMNNFRSIDRSKMQWDFLCNSHEPIAYEEEILAAGSRTFHITARSQSIPKYEKELHAFFREHAKEYDAIWVNVSSLANIDYLICAKRYGIKRPDHPPVRHGFLGMFPVGGGVVLPGRPHGSGGAGTKRHRSGETGL